MNTIHLSWDDLDARFRAVVPTGAKVYGIPRGGMLACHAYYGHMVFEPERADVLVDDVFATGATAEWWGNRYRKPVIPLYAKAEFPPGTWLVFPWEINRDTAEKGPEDAVVRLLEFIGEDWNREGLRDTPRRVLRALKEMTKGYHDVNFPTLLKSFEDSSDEMVILRGIRFSSLCEHHLLPFTGEAAVGYLPQGRVVGISKLARLVEVFAKRLQIQEHMTREIAEALNRTIQPLGVGVIVKAHHACMGCRWVNQPTASMVTSCMLGAFRENGPARAEFLASVDGKRD